MAPITLAKLIGCARCGLEHENIEFKPLMRHQDEWSHWAPCPTTGEPIMLASPGDQRQQNLPLTGSLP